MLSKAFLAHAGIVGFVLLVFLHLVSTETSISIQDASVSSFATTVSLVIACVGMGLLMTNTHFSRPVCAVVSLGFWFAVLWIGVMVSLKVGVGLGLVAVWMRQSLLLFPPRKLHLSNNLF